MSAPKVRSPTACARSDEMLSGVIRAQERKSDALSAFDLSGFAGGTPLPYLERADWRDVREKKRDPHQEPLSPPVKFIGNGNATP